MSDITSNVPREVLRPHRPDRRTPQGRRDARKQECEPGCCCVQCSMRTLTRPRYYAGQLLADVDLRDEQAYQIAKTRLHNRYLHGFGVVCGLQVACDACDEGSVVIEPGYALGPCGEDILVPCAESLDVMKAIDACRTRPGDCDPLVRRPDDIDRAEEHWCITLAYDEQEVTPKAALRSPGRSTCGCSEGRGCGSGDACECGGSSGCGCRSSSRPSSGCGCGKGSNGNGHDHGNGNGGAHKGECSCGKGCTCGPVPSRVYEPGKGLSCEPTRVRETYRLGVVERACATCDTSLRESHFAKAGREVGSALGLFTARMGTANLMALAMYAFVPYGSLPDDQQQPTKVTNTLLSGKRAMWELYTDNPLGVPCPDLVTVKEVEVLDPPQDEPTGEQPTGQVPSQQWQSTQRTAAVNVLTLGLRYLWEYLCAKLQPPCPPDPCDDRLILACVTVREGKVVGVCNFSCRKRAGSFTARDYWLSLFGIKPLVLWLLELLCCGDLIRARSPIRNRLADLLEFVDPEGELRAAVARDDFRRVRRVAKDFSSVRDRIDVASVAAAVRSVVAPREGADLLAHLDRPVGEVEKDLDRAGVAHTVRDVDAPPPMAAARAAALSGTDDVVLLRDATTGRLAGAERASRPIAEVRAERRRVEQLSSEVKALRSELVALRREDEAAKKATAKKATSRKATTKKATSKKATAKKSTSKKSTSKKATAKKSTGKKSTSKRTTRRGGSS